ncbi:hypothetical protein SMD22_00310 (plasmid) [Brevibacillus halotolerans]|nr:hypothetical protein SMD22_00310 [Brevibacillus halotolerans]
MSVVGFCGNCDRQFKFHEGTVRRVSDDDDTVLPYVHIICPICEEYDEVKIGGSTITEQ